MNRAASTPGNSGGDASFPPGTQNAFLFAVFNAMSFQIVQGSPIVLYAKSLGASATVLGIIAGMMPLLVIFQIPAASHVNRIGYKRFVLGGWSTRIVFIFALAFVPLTGRFLDSKNQLALVLVLLFCFNLSRGISSCAWLPWITALIPATLRGKYLLRDAANANLGSGLTLVVAAFLLSGETQPWQFSAILVFSAVTGVTSLAFLKRIPDVPAEELAKTSGTPVPWLAMLQHPPFKKLLVTLVAWSVAYGGMSAFTVAFLRSATGMSEGKILLVTSVAFLGGLSSLWLLGARLDRFGSKPMLGMACLVWIGVLAGWMALAGGLLETKLLVLISLQFLMGLLAALVSMACNRLAMAIIPVMGRNHFFALYSVVGNFTLGLAPIGWGVLIDFVGPRSVRWLWLDWNRFTVFFFLAAVVFSVTLLLARRLDEPAAASLETMLRDILIQSPQKFWLRFWPRD